MPVDDRPAVRQRTGLRIEDRHGHGGESSVAGMGGEGVELGQQLGGRQPLQGHGASGAAQLRHVLDGRQAVPHHIAHRQVGSLLRQGHDVVPVATEPVLTVCRFIG